MLFENKKDKVYTVNKNNIALNGDNDKRRALADSNVSQMIFTLIQP